MKLVIIPPAFASDVDGIEFVLVKERAKALAPFFDSVTVIAGVEKETSRDGIFYSSVSMDNGRLTYFRDVRRILHKLGNDAILLNYSPFYPGIVASLAAKSLGVKVCTNFIGAPEGFATGNKFAKNVSFKGLMKLSDRVITTSEFLKDRLKKIHNKDIRVVHNAVRPGFKPLRIKKIRNSLLYVGRLSQEKRVDHLIRAVHLCKNKNIRLYVVGGGPQRKELENLTKNYGIEKNVTFVGHKSTTDVVKWMNRCAVFVLPTKHEGFGMVAIEAMRCGMPVIAMKYGGPVTVVGKSGILVNPDDLKALSDAITSLLSDKKERARLTKYGIKRSKEFDYETWGKRLYTAMVK